MHLSIHHINNLMRIPIETRLIIRFPSLSVQTYDVIISLFVKFAAQKQERGRHTNSPSQ